MSARSRIVAAVLLVPLLASCSTPRERCIDAATERYRVTADLVSELRQTIERGYALDRQRVPYTVFDTCYRTHPDSGRIYAFSCPYTAWRTETRPVAVDIAQERAKLAGYEERLPGLREAAARGVGACRARFPDEGRGG